MLGIGVPRNEKYGREFYNEELAVNRNRTCRLEVRKSPPSLANTYFLHECKKRGCPKRAIFNNSGSREGKVSVEAKKRLICRFCGTLAPFV